MWDIPVRFRWETQVKPVGRGIFLSRGGYSCSRSDIPVILTLLGDSRLTPVFLGLILTLISGYSLIIRHIPDLNPT